MPVFRLRRSRNTRHIEFLFGCPAIVANGTRLKDVFHLVATHTDRQKLPPFRIYDCNGASGFGMRRSIDRSHFSIVGGMRSAVGWARDLFKAKRVQLTASPENLGDHQERGNCQI